MRGDESEWEGDAESGSEGEKAEADEGAEENEAGNIFHDGGGLREMTGFISQA
jgi:hypothetical protein